MCFVSSCAYRRCTCSILLFGAETCLAALAVRYLLIEQKEKGKVENRKGEEQINKSPSEHGTNHSLAVKCCIQIPSSRSGLFREMMKAYKLLFDTGGCPCFALRCNDCFTTPCLTKAISVLLSSHSRMSHIEHTLAFSQGYRTLFCVFHLFYTRRFAMFSQ